ncbi:MAG: hypothetical protein RIS17_769 [Pseudomonadota bacterium]|jgi:IclR family pca regulon transcriptional regulator
MAETAEPVSDRDYVNALARGLEVISAFNRTRPRMTLSEIARITGLTRATVRRLLLTLVREGYVEKQDNLFALTPKLLRLGHQALSSLSIVEVAQPIMNELARTLRETVLLGVLTGDDVFCIARASSDRLVNIVTTVGHHAPAYATSPGRVLLAGEPDDALDRYLERTTLQSFTPNTITCKVALRTEIEWVRRMGYAISEQELEIGLGSVSVPVLHPDGRVIAVLNVSCPSARAGPEERRTHFLPAMLAASQAITRGL